MRRRFRRRPPAAAIAVVVIGLIVASRVGYDLALRARTAPVADPLAEGIYEVVRVVDGDTIVISHVPPWREEGGGAGRAVQPRVRLVGINAPESVAPDQPVEPYGAEAAEFTRQFLSGGQVRLRFDRRKLDKYDRFLAYVFVGDVMLNEELVRCGLAWADHYPGDSASMARRIRKAEQQAREAQRGIWSTTGADSPRGTGRG